MTDIPIQNALLLWDSGIDQTPRFAVRALGHPDYDKYGFSNGACFKAWRDAATSDQKMKLMVELWHITAFYAVPPEIMKDELLKIPEYRDMIADDCLPAKYQNERFAED